MCARDCALCWIYRDKNIISALGVQSLAGDTDENAELQYNGLSIETETNRMCHSSSRRMGRVMGLRGVDRGSYSEEVICTRVN